MTCGIDGCLQSFRLYSSITSHFKRKHPGKSIDITSQPSMENDPTRSTCQHHPVNSSNPADDSATMQGGDCSDQCLTDIDPGSSLNASNQLQRSAALFLLNMKERYKLTQSAVNFAVDQIRQMVTLAVEEAQTTLLSSSNDNGTNLPKIESADPFSGLETEHMQTKFYREQFGLVVSLFKD